MIADYAIIGDCRSAALISKAGSLDWLCWPRFDSPALFCALLDRARGGSFVLQPAVPFTSQRRYVENTNVLETEFRTSTGITRLTDLMPVASEADKRRTLWPEHQILRRIECLTGEVPMLLRYEPRPDYARRMPRLRPCGRLGIHAEHGVQLLSLTTDFPVTIEADGASASTTFGLRAGERRYASLAFSDSEPAIIPPLGEEAERRIQTSIDWWQAWAARCRYAGPHRASVVRSALVLKLMTFAPSGAVVAAPTTSIPERPGGERNWDYRYCWLRDASLTLQALHDLGYSVEAHAYLSWLVHATRVTWPRLRPLYDVYGEPQLPESELDHLEGFAGSRPVRIGNGAAGQLQLDVYGEVLDAAYQLTRRGGELDGTTARMLGGFGETVCRCWHEPDEGIWEIRGGRRHHTFSKAMCWVGLDRLVRLHDEGHVRIARDRMVATRDAIRIAVEEKGYSARLGSYIGAFDVEDVDASLLLLSRYGYAAPGSPRMRGTLEAVLARLGRNGLLYRYLTDDGLPPGEGAFGICSFWAVDALARGGDMARAAALFEHLLGYANDIGLYAEEIDPETGAALGNFPQAFTHVGLIDAALTLQEQRGAASRAAA